MNLEWALVVVMSDEDEEKHVITLEDGEGE